MLQPMLQPNLRCRAFAATAEVAGETIATHYSHCVGGQQHKGRLRRTSRNSLTIEGIELVEDLYARRRDTEIDHATHQFQLEYAATLNAEESPVIKESTTMSQIYNSLGRVFWGLGMVNLAAGVVLKAVPSGGDRIHATPHGILILAGVLFLCTLATREVGRTIPSGN